MPYIFYAADAVGCIFYVIRNIRCIRVFYNCVHAIYYIFQRFTRTISLQLLLFFPVILHSYHIIMYL